MIALTVPFAIFGMTVGLLSTGTPFGFVALLGAMSLAGMMIKNAIVLPRSERRFDGRHIAI
jgi:multidrug efflux pump subunit AcrB